MREWFHPFLLVVLLTLIATDAVRADVGLLPPDERFPAMRFDNLDDYPKYDFYLAYALGPGNPFAGPPPSSANRSSSKRKTP
jgi:hypothetical protein